MTQYVVGATRVVGRPWPAGRGDTQIETREVPEGVVHAVDPESGQALCGSSDRLVVLDTPWEETWRLSYVGGPARCSRCVVLSIDEDSRQQVIAQLERFLADADEAGDERRRQFANDSLRLLREASGEET